MGSGYFHIIYEFISTENISGIYNRTIVPRQVLSYGSVC